MPVPQPLLRGTERAFDIEMLATGSPGDELHPGERRILGATLPPWQRPEVWSTHQKTRFIEGVFLGLGCGYRVCNGMHWLDGGQRAPMSGWLLDGQQRAAAIRDFVEDHLTVFQDVTFSRLSAADVRRFLRTPFPVIELEYTDDEAKLMDLYKRLAFGGTPHRNDDQEWLDAHREVLPSP